MELIRGVCPVLAVPFHDNGDVDFDGFATVVQRMLASGVTAVMFPGFASEFFALDDTERAALGKVMLEHTGRVVAGIVSVPDYSTYHAVRQAVAAAELGAAAVNILPPYQLPTSGPAIVAHLRAVLTAVAPLPVIVQYAPALTGTSLSATVLSELAGECPNLRFVKVEATPPGRYIAELAAAKNPLPALVGYAGLQMPDALRRGAVGVQPGSSFVEIYQEFWRLWHTADQDAAVALHQRMTPYLSYWMQNVPLLVAAEKEISRRRGWFGSSHCRTPNYQLDSEEMAMIDRFLVEFADLLSAP